VSDERDVFHVVMIKPTHYHDDGYPIRWLFSPIPSNSLASVYGLSLDCAARNVLGDDVRLEQHVMDETNAYVDHSKLIRRITRDGGKALICMVGVQSNQFPRAVDLSQPFLAAGFPVCIGGFHVSGCTSMLPEMPDDMKQAQAMGISFFIGEAEDGRFERVIRDAYAGALKPVYDYSKDLPDLPGQPIPFLPKQKIGRTLGGYTSFDVGRGCPFECSFCTIINVQGRKSRFRTAQDLERIVRENHAQGIHKFFITDDNLARNKNWEELFDCLIALRAQGIKTTINIQVDTMCHRIPGFIDKACRAGARSIFIGLENINPDNLLAAKKRQNKITEYREMLLAWKQYGVSIICGYILGFPNDTKESFLRDIEIIKRELPIDQLYFTNLTPLPGSEDHRRLYDQGTWMDPDMNKYDLNHRVIHHERMSDHEWDEAFREAWLSFYSYEHMETIIRRLFAIEKGKKKTVLARLAWWRFFPVHYGVHPLEGGYLPLKRRHDRRSSFPRENPVVFYAKYVYDVARFHYHYLKLRSWLKGVIKEVQNDPKRLEYRDLALTPTSEEEYDVMDLYQSTSGGVAAVKKKQKQAAIRDAVTAASDTVAAAE